MEYTNSRIREIIGEYIHNERNRKILERRLIDGTTFERIAYEFELSVSQVKRIIRKNEGIVFRHFPEEMIPEQK